MGPSRRLATQRAFWFKLLELVDRCASPLSRPAGTGTSILNYHSHVYWLLNFYSLAVFLNFLNLLTLWNIHPKCQNWKPCRPNSYFTDEEMEANKSKEIAQGHRESQ